MWLSRQHPSQQDHEPFYASDATLSFTTNREEPVKLPPLTWGDAVEWRISSQASGFRHRFPLGSFEMPQWR